MQYELRGHKLYQRILAHAAYQQRVLVFSVTRNFGRVNIARYFFFHETLSWEAGAEFNSSMIKQDGRDPPHNLVVAMASGGPPEILKTAKASVLSDFFAKRGNTTLSLSTSKGDAHAFVRLIVELDGVSHRVTFKMTKWTSDFAASWQKVTGVAAGPQGSRRPTIHGAFPRSPASTRRARRQGSDSLSPAQGSRIQQTPQIGDTQPAPQRELPANARPRPYGPAALDMETTDERSFRSRAAALQRRISSGAKQARPHFRQVHSARRRLDRRIRWVVFG